MSDYIDIDWTSKDQSYFLSAKTDVDAKLGTVRLQVADAKRTFASGGQASDVGWLRRAESAVIALSRISQKLQLRLRNLKEEQKALNIASTESAQRTFRALLRELVVSIKQASLGEDGSMARYKAALAAAQVALGRSAPTETEA
jgi:hypothetical protein